MHCLPRKPPALPDRTHGIVACRGEHRCVSPARRAAGPSRPARPIIAAVGGSRPGDRLSHHPFEHPLAAARPPRHSPVFRNRKNPRVRRMHHRPGAYPVKREAREQGIPAIHEKPVIINGVIPAPARVGRRHGGELLGQGPSRAAGCFAILEIERRDRPVNAEQPVSRVADQRRIGLHDIHWQRRRPPVGNAAGNQRSRVVERLVVRAGHNMQKPLLIRRNHRTAMHIHFIRVRAQSVRHMLSCYHGSGSAIQRCHVGRVVRARFAGRHVQVRHVHTVRLRKRK